MTSSRDHRAAERAPRHDRSWAWTCALAVLSLYVAGCAAEANPPLRVAVSANFYATALELADAFQQESGMRISLIPGSSGKHVAQIRAGAPYDVLLSADTLRPGLLVREGFAPSAWVYAEGILVVWSPSAATPDGARASLLAGGSRVAIANPELAPYGLAAQQVLDALRSPANRIYGENVSQARQFTEIGSVQTGLVALAQVPEARRSEVWVVPDSLYGRILQAGVVLSDRPAGRDFRTFLDSDQARAIIRRGGYRLDGE